MKMVSGEVKGRRRKDAWEGRESRSEGTCEGDGNLLTRLVALPIFLFLYSPRFLKYIFASFSLCDFILIFSMVVNNNM